MVPQRHFTLSAYLSVCCIVFSFFSTGQCASLHALRRNAQSVSLLESQDRDRLGSLTGPIHTAASSARKMLQAGASPAPRPTVSAGLVNVSAIFAFGDSTTDTGENNYVNTTSRADFPPYGETWPGYPTGRYSDGKLVVDFLAQAWEFPLLPPFLQPNASFARGANFASAGSGALNSTSDGGQIWLQTQLQQFLGLRNGSFNGSALLPNSTVSNAVFLVSTGTNDYTHYALDLGGILNKMLVAPDDYVSSVVSSISTFLQGLYAAGARQFLVANVPAVGCAPEARLVTLNNSCFDPLNDLADAHNRLLNATIQNLTVQYSDATFLVGDTYGLLKEATAQPSNFGFQVSNVACCGAGPNNATLSCGQNRTIFDIFTVSATSCADPETHVFWDVEHGTEAFYRFVAREFLLGTSFVHPQNLTATFAFPPGVESRLT